MAAASYGHDLTDWIIDSDTAAWGELTNAASGGAPDEADTESALQGTNTVSQATNTTSLCSMARILGAPVTFTSGHVALVWHGHGVATALATYANNGLRVAFAGSSLANWKSYTVGGSDVAPLPYGKWVNNAVDPSLTADATNGTPPTGGTDIYGVGSMCQLTQVVAKGQPHVCDIIRYGRAEARFSGGDLANGYATFAGFAALNDASTARWGLISSTTGGYQWKGLITLGYVSAVDFRDSNVNVFIQDCRKVSSGFNKIEIRQASSRVDLTSISFINASPSTNASRGTFEVIDNAAVTLDSCSFTDMGTFKFLSNSVVSGTTFRRCDQIQVGNGTSGATFNSNTTFVNSHDTTGAILVTAPADMANMSYCNFTNNTVGIKITTAGTYSFNGHQFSGNTWQVDFTGTGSCIINPSNGSNVSQGSVHATGGGTITVNTPSVNLTFTGVINGSEIRVIRDSDGVELDGVESVSGGTWTYSHQLAGTVVNIYIHHIDYQWYPIKLYTLIGSNTSIPVQQAPDRTFANP